MIWGAMEQNLDGDGIRLRRSVNEILRHSGEGDWDRNVLHRME